MDLAAFRGKNPAHRVQVQRVSYKHVQRLGGDRYDVAAPDMGSGALDRFRQRLFRVNLNKVGGQIYSREPIASATWIAIE